VFILGTTKTINDYQKNIYENYERDTADSYIENYRTILSGLPTDKTLRLIDIGGSSGYFVKKILENFPELNLKITVLDNTKYSTWDNNWENIEFIQDSADNIEKIFGIDYFDIIFANRVYHHMVSNTFKKTLIGMQETTDKFYNVLKKDGLLCIIDTFSDGLLFDKAPSRLVFLSTSYNGIFTKFIRKLGAKSAGIGVCMRSEKMWISMIHKTKFKIQEIKHGPNSFIPIFQKIFLFIKDYYEDSIMILKKE
jgi:ubiquinone/menaquinone biosynthesis C-methylase UbiE